MQDNEPNSSRIRPVVTPAGHSSGQLLILPQANGVEEFHDSNCSNLDSSDDNKDPDDEVVEQLPQTLLDNQPSELVTPIVLQIPNDKSKGVGNQGQMEKGKSNISSEDKYSLKIGLLPVEEESLISPGKSFPEIGGQANLVSRSSSEHRVMENSQKTPLSENPQNNLDQTPHFGEHPSTSILLNRLRTSSPERNESRPYPDCSKLTPLVTELQSELNTKDRQLAEYRDLLKAISFGDVESPRFRRQSSKINHSLEDTQIRNTVSDKTGEVHPREAGCRFCVELQKLTIELQNEALETDAKLRALRQENIDLKLELAESLGVENKPEVARLEVFQTDYDQANNDQNNLKVEKELEEIKISASQPSGNPELIDTEQIKGHLGNSERNLGLKTMNQKLPDVNDEVKTLQEKIKGLVEGQKKHEKTAYKLKEALHQERNNRLKIEQALFGQIRLLEKKNAEVSQRLLENILDKEKLIDLLGDYETKCVATEELGGADGEEIVKLREKTHQVEFFNSKLKNEIEALKREIEKKADDLISLKRVNFDLGKAIQEESEKVQQHQRTIEEKTSENASLNYRLQSVFELVKRKQQDEEEAASSLKSLLTKIKEAQCQDLPDQEGAPESFGKMNRSTVSQNAPLSFFSHKSKSEAEFDHRDMAGLNSDLENAIQDLICQASYLRSANRDLEQRAEKTRQECTRLSEEKIRLQSMLKEGKFQIEVQEIRDQVQNDPDGQKNSSGVERQPGREERESQSELGRQTQSFRDSLQRLDFGIKETDNQKVGSVMSLDVFHPSPSGKKSPSFGGHMKNYQFPLFENSSERLIELKKCLQEGAGEKVKQEPSVYDKETCTDDLVCHEISKGEKPSGIESEQLLPHPPQDILSQGDHARDRVSSHLDLLQENHSEKSKQGEILPKQDDVTPDEQESINQPAEKVEESESLDLELDSSPSFDWKSALWKCYLASVNNECDENSEHLKMSELVPYAIEKINALHSKVAELSESNKALSESVARKESRLERLIEETNQAEDIINELLAKCDKLEKEAAQNSKPEGQEIPELTVSDFLSNITPGKKAVPDMVQGTSECKAVDLEAEIARLNRVNRAQGRVLDALIKEIVTYQSILKQDRDRDESVELTLSILSKILLVLDDSVDPARSSNDTHEKSHLNEVSKAMPNKEADDLYAGYPNKEIPEEPIPTFGGSTVSDCVVPELSKQTHKIENKTRQEEGTKTVKEIREAVAAQKDRIQRLSSEMSSRKKPRVNSTNGSSDASHCRNLMVLFDSSKAKDNGQIDRDNLARKFVSEAAEQKNSHHARYDSLQPALLGSGLPTGPAHFSKKLTPYPDHHFSMASSEDDILACQVVDDPAIQEKLLSMGSTIKLLKERLDLNISRITLLEENQESLKKELAAKKMENQELQKQISLMGREKTPPRKSQPPSRAARVPSRNTKSAIRTANKVTVKEKEDSKGHFEGQDIWSIKLTPRHVKDGQPNLVQECLLTHSPLTTSQVLGTSQVSCPTGNHQHQVDNKFSHPDKRLKEDCEKPSGSPLIPQQEKIERGLATIQIKLMELINKKYSLKTLEAESVHRDVKMNLEDLSRITQTILAESTAVADDSLASLAKGFQKIDLLAAKATHLGKSYSDLDEAAVRLVKKLSGKSRQPGLLKVKEYIKTSEINKARLLVEQLAKSGRTAREKQVSSLGKAAEAARKDWLSLQALVQAREFKLDQICSSHGERLDQLLASG